MLQRKVPLFAFVPYDRVIFNLAVHDSGVENNRPLDKL